MVIVKEHDETLLGEKGDHVSIVRRGFLHLESLNFFSGGRMLVFDVMMEVGLEVDDMSEPVSFIEENRLMAMQLPATHDTTWAIDLSFNCVPRSCNPLRSIDTSWSGGPPGFSGLIDQIPCADYLLTYIKYFALSARPPFRENLVSS